MKARAGGALLALAIGGACQRHGAGADVASAPAEVVAAGAASGCWQIRAVQAVIDGDADVGWSGPIDIAAWARRSLADQPLVAAVGAGATPIGCGVAALDFAVAWLRVDDRGNLLLPSDRGAANLAIVVQAQAEAAVAGARRVEIAARATQLVLPMPDVADRAGWLQPRVERALAQAAGDVLAELTARRAADSAVISGLDAADTWTIAASAREVGERKLVAARPRLEAYAADSRKEIAVVAVAALGRLGDAGSAIVLARAAQRTGHRDVALAAVDALADLRTAEARDALATLARDHADPIVRDRAARAADPTALPPGRP